MSYGFPITNFCNTGVHYETPCIMRDEMKVIKMLASSGRQQQYG
jgi:hypothetical protein